MRWLTLPEIESAFKKWGVPYAVVPGAAKRSNSNGFGSTSVTGCMFHHTAGDATDARELSVLVNGRTGLSGPLCNFGAGDDGIIDIIACGSANHAGGGDPDTLKLVQTEKTPLTAEVKPNQSAASAGSVGGNDRFYGWEVYYGIRNDPTPNPLQYRVTVLSMAAIIDKLDELDKANTWSGRAAIGHREWTTNKIDPSAVKMYEVRTQINAILKAGPAAGKNWYLTGKLETPGGPVATPIAPVYRGTTAAQDVVKAFLASDVFIASDGNKTTNPYWSGKSWFQFAGQGIYDTEKKVDALSREVATLKALLVEVHDKLIPPTA